MNIILKKYGLIIFSTLLFIIYLINPFQIFVSGNELTFFSIVIACLTIEFFIRKAKNGEEIYMRPIAAMKAFGLLLNTFLVKNSNLLSAFSVTEHVLTGQKYQW